MGVTSIEWTDRNWPWARGCSRVSEGCRNCYAERMAARFPWGKGFAEMTNAGPRWTGRVEFQPQALNEPLRRRKPARWFPSTFDPFHESLDFNDIAAVYGVMAAAEQHTFQILTKRPERRLLFHERLGHDPLLTITSALSRQKVNFPRALDLSHEWPLLNVWEGVSVEDQATADERIPKLLDTPAAVRFISLEPQLASVNLEPFLWCWDDGGPEPVRPRLDWVIQGGESGPGARPFARTWAETVRGQCAAAGVPYFLKQMGRWILGDHTGFSVNHWLLADGRGFVPPMLPSRNKRRPDAIGFSLVDPKGGDMAAWAPDLRVREFPNGARS